MRVVPVEYWTSGGGSVGRWVGGMLKLSMVSFSFCCRSPAYVGVQKLPLASHKHGIMQGARGVINAETRPTGMTC